MSNDTTEHDKARQALALLSPDALCRIDPPMVWRDANKCRARAEDILNRHGPCPGFWAEVLAAVRVLSSCRYCAVVYDPEALVWLVLHVDCTDTTPRGPTEPDAILAALRAVTKREGAG